MEIQGGEDRSDKLWGDLLGAAGTIQLPGDLMIQIISRLPVKSILRFKSVCRAWYSLFSHPNFIQHHSRISNSYAKMNNLLSFLVHTTNNKGSLSLLLDRSCGGRIWIDLDLAFRFKYIEVIGSLNGLVCLTLNMIATSIVLWNPATRKHSRIPNSKLLSRRGENLIWGFVYDHETDIYKVVRVLFFNCWEGVVTARVEIYNTGTNTWRTTKIVGFPGNNMDLSRSSVEVGGVLYWFSQYGGSTSKQFIVSFDASSEAFRFHPLPPESMDDKSYPVEFTRSMSWRLEAMGEHLVLMFCEYSDKLHQEFICIESVNARKLNRSEDGGDDSFHIEKLTVEPLPDLKWIVRICGNGKIIAEDLDQKLLVFDREETKYLPSQLWGGYHRFYDYNESLVWPSRLA